MSSYQYYEFQAIDRPLTPEEQQAVARLSSRVEPHPRRAVFTYSWSDFRGDPAEILAKYYDAMLYMASWGSARLMFRFPRELADAEFMQQYQVKTLEYPSDAVTASLVGEHTVLDIQFRDEEGGEWIEGEGWLDSLLLLRDDVLQGDNRRLYLAWLGGLMLEYDVDMDAPEPPVPPGLKRLTPALRRFVDLFGIDEMLVAAAAEGSGEAATASEEWLRHGLARLTRAEGDAFLLRLAQGEPHLGLALRRRLRVLAGDSLDEVSSGAARRTVGELLARAEQRREEDRRRRAEEAERKRIAELEALATREAEAWRQVYELIERKTGSAYDEAVELLRKLRDLAEHEGRRPGFGGRVREIREQYSRRSALMRRLDQTGLG